MNENLQPLEGLRLYHERPRRIGKFISRFAPFIDPVVKTGQFFDLRGKEWDVKVKNSGEVSKSRAKMKGVDVYIASAEAGAIYRFFSEEELGYSKEPNMAPPLTEETNFQKENEQSPDL